MAPAAPRMPALPTRAQEKLRTLKLWLGPEEMETELALTMTEKMTGMMFRTNMDENTGMLFVYGGPIQASFWMKNTFVPLSAAYIDPSGAIVEIHDLKPQDTNAVVSQNANVQYILETRQGWFERHHVGVGTLVRSEVGTLGQTFTARAPGR